MFYFRTQATKLETEETYLIRRYSGSMIENKMTITITLKTEVSI